MSSDNHRRRQQQAEDNAIILSFYVMVGCFLTGFVVDMVGEMTTNKYVQPVAAIICGAIASGLVFRWYLHHHAPKQ